MLKTKPLIAALSLFTLIASQASAHSDLSVDRQANDWGLNSASQILGMHEMDATVSAVDMKTGSLDVVASGMPLKLHYPPKALQQAALVPGDKVTIHLSFTKP